MNSIPIRRDTAGATRILIRNSEVTPNQASQLQNQEHGERESEIRRDKSEVPEAGGPEHHPAEHGERSMEESERQLSSEMRTQNHWNPSETRTIRQAEEPPTEREQWDMWRTALKARAEALEASSSALEQAVLLEQEKLEQKHAAEILQLENARLVLEQAKRQAEDENLRLRESLAAAEARIESQNEQLRAERERWNLWRTALNARLQAVEAGSRALEQAVLLEHGKAAEKYSGEMSQLENSRLALEQEKRQSEEENTRLRESLAEAQARVENQAEQLRAEREAWELTRATLEQRHITLESKTNEQREQLAQAEESRRQLEKRASALSDELSQLMERYSQTVEESRSLEEKLRVVENSHRELSEEREAYRLKWENSKIELDQMGSDVQSLSALARESAEKHQQLLNKLRELSAASEQTSPQ